MCRSIMVVSSMASIMAISVSMTSSSSSAPIMGTIMTSSMTFTIFHIHSRYNVCLLFTILLFLALFVMIKIIKDRRCMLITMNCFQHLLSLLWGTSWVSLLLVTGLFSLFSTVLAFYHPPLPG